MAPRLVSPLSDLKMVVGQYVNILGVVVEFSIPRQSKGTSYLMSLKIVDDSSDEQEQEVNVNMFMEDSTAFPVILTRGEVIYVMNVNVEIFNEKPAATFSSLSSFLHPVSDVGNPSSQSTAGNPSRQSTGDNIAQKADGLRSWYQTSQLSSGDDEYLLSIYDLFVNEHFDLICKVLSIDSDYDDELGMCACLYAWDGTDARIERVNRKFCGEGLNTFPINKEYDNLHPDFLSSFPQAGTVVKIMVPAGHPDDDIYEYFTFENSWVTLRNMDCGFYRGVWGARSVNLKVRLLRETDLTVQERLRSYEQRSSTEDVA